MHLSFDWYTSPDKLQEQCPVYFEICFSILFRKSSSLSIYGFVGSNTSLVLRKFSVYVQMLMDRVHGILQIVNYMLSFLPSAYFHFPVCSNVSGNVTTQELFGTNLVSFYQVALNQKIFKDFRFSNQSVLANAAILDVGERSPDIILEEDHPRSITSKSVLIWPSGS